MKFKNQFTLLLLAIIIVFISSCGDDDGMASGENLPTLTVDDITKFEGEVATTIDFKVRLSAASTEGVQVDYKTQDGTAEAGKDYTAQTGTLSFAAGETESTITVEVVGDTLREADETIMMLLSNPINATIAEGTASGILRNDDSFTETAEDGYITPDSYSGYNLVWRDEFDGPNIDASSWTHEIGGGGWGNNELQHYTDRADNSFIENGKLVIEAKEESFNGNSFTSARMITANKKEFQYGRIDIRAKLPEGQGIWPALWSLGATFFTQGWPSCGEIDIMELVGHEPDRVHGTAHYGQQGSPSTFVGNGYTSSKKFSEEYNVFSLIWTQDHVEWYVNDQKFHGIDKGSIGSLYPFNSPFFFIFNIAVGGNWPGNPNSTTVFPQQMHVDYIRVFQ